MAFQLRGSIRIKDDGASKALKKIQETTKMTQKATDQFRGSTDKLRSAHGQFESQAKRTHSILRGLGSAATGAGRAFGSARSQSAGLMRSVIGLGAAFLSVKAASGLINMSIGGAANLEMQSMQLEALLGNAKKAQQLFNSMNTKGMKSVFSESDFLEGAKAFLPLTKSLTQIDTLTSLQERLASSNPLEGMQGAAFSIREALSGDTVSLSERFNIPKSMVTNLRKTTSMSGKIKALDKILTSMGYTQAYLNKVNESASAQWDNLGSNIKMSFARSGKQALEMLKPFLKDMNAFLSSDRASQMFSRWGTALSKLALAAANFGRWLLDRGGKAFEYLDKNYFSNPKFQSLPFADKIHTVFSDIETKFKAWYGSGGKTMMENGAAQLVSFLAGALKASQPLIDAAVTMGKSIGSGLLTGLNEFAKANPAMAAIMTFLATPGPLQVKAAAAVAVGGGAVVEKYQIPAGANPDTLPKWQRPFVQPPHKDTSKMPWYEKALPSNWGWMPGNIPSHASGLDFVPYDNYTARLHKSEMVLTKDEAKDYRDGQSGKGGAPIVNITGNTFHVRNDMDIEKVAWKLAHYMAD